MTILKSTALVVHPVHLVLLNFSVSIQHWLTENEHSLFGFLPASRGRRERDEALSLSLFRSFRPRTCPFGWTERTRTVLSVLEAALRRCDMFLANVGHVIGTTVVETNRYKGYGHFDSK